MGFQVHVAGLHTLPIVRSRAGQGRFRNVAPLHSCSCSDKNLHLEIISSDQLTTPDFIVVFSLTQSSYTSVVVDSIYLIPMFLVIVPFFLALL